MIIITIINTDVWLYPQPPIHLKKKMLPFSNYKMITIKNTKVNPAAL